MASGSAPTGTRLPALRTLRCRKLFRIKSQVQSELCVELNQTGRSDRSRPQSSKKTVRQTSVGVVKFTEFDCFCLCVHCGSALAIEILKIGIWCACQSLSRKLHSSGLKDRWCNLDIRSPAEVSTSGDAGPT